MVKVQEYTLKAEDGQIVLFVLTMKKRKESQIVRMAITVAMLVT